MGAWARLAYVGANDQHVRELQCEGRVGYGRAETADQVRGSLACSVHNGTVRLGFNGDIFILFTLICLLTYLCFPTKTKFVMD